MRSARFDSAGSGAAASGTASMGASVSSTEAATILKRGCAFLPMIAGLASVGVRETRPLARGAASASRAKVRRMVASVSRDPLAVRTARGHARPQVDCIDASAAINSRLKHVAYLTPITIVVQLVLWLY